MPQRRRFTAAHELGHFLLHGDLERFSRLSNRGKALSHCVPTLILCTAVSVSTETALIDEKGHLDRLFGGAAAENPTAPLSESNEVQASQFAVDFLMPAAELRRAYDPTADNIQEMAKVFGVSQKAMKIRLKLLGLIGQRSRKD